jgi:hypothetical protein
MTVHGGDHRLADFEGWWIGACCTEGLSVLLGKGLFPQAHVGASAEGLPSTSDHNSSDRIVAVTGSVGVSQFYTHLPTVGIEMLRAVEFDNRYSIAHFKTNILVAHSLSPLPCLYSLFRLHIGSTPNAASANHMLISHTKTKL